MSLPQHWDADIKTLLRFLIDMPQRESLNWFEFIGGSFLCCINVIRAPGLLGAEHCLVLIPDIRTMRPPLAEHKATIEISFIGF